MGSEAPQSWTFTVHHDIGQCSQNALRNKHWTAVHRLTHAARLAGYRAWIDAGGMRYEGKVRVSLVIRRARSLDPANLPGACKGVLDGVLVGIHIGTKEQRRLLPALLPDDSARWVDSVTARQETGKEHKGRETVLVIVEAVEA